ncbi:MAG: hypothetical protein WBW33_25420, partial [Bryobacteraceae bacterium]
MSSASSAASRLDTSSFFSSGLARRALLRRFPVAFMSDKTQNIRGCDNARVRVSEGTAGTPRWGRVMRELQADGQWPVWVAPKDPAKADIEGYGGIASFVTPAALENFPAVFRPGLRDLLRQRTGKDGADLDRVVVEKLWEALVDHDIPYDAPPWNPAKGQRIRDPEWLLRRHGAGTCVDLGLLFAAACLREQLDTSMVMLRGPRRA